MSDAAKDAKIAAKVAKAEAKALRPFYKKKRWWLVGGVAVIVVASVAGAGSSEQTSNSGSNSETSGGVSSGLGSKDASADVIDLDCGQPDIIGAIYPKVTIKNNSSKASTYFITVVYESADGATRYDSTIVSSMGLGPGQTTVEEGIVMGDIPSGAICKVTEVQRTAS
jgi:hypothetical protein